MSNAPSSEFESALALLDGHSQQATLFERPARNLAEKVVNDCHKIGAKILYPGHPEYPEALLELPRPPKFLSCLGSTEALRSRRTLSIVGGREPSPAAERWLDRHLAEFLMTDKVVVVSGGARGIDQKAHFISLRHGTPTVALLPSGLGQLYPPSLESWRHKLLEGGGALLSTYPPWQEIRKTHFEARNLLIAALGEKVFVVEAKRRSGSLITARQAHRLSRSVAALPSFPGDIRSAGTLDLIVDGGASIIRDAKDLKAFFG